jgi:hypothetical protein
LGRDQEAQDGAAVRLSNDFEDRFHSLRILHRAYTCQGIYNGGRFTREKAAKYHESLGKTKLYVNDKVVAEARMRRW